MPDYFELLLQYFPCVPFMYFDAGKIFVQPHPELAHPQTGQALVFCSPVPKDMAVLLDKLGLKV